MPIVEEAERERRPPVSVGHGGSWSWFDSLYVAVAVMTNIGPRAEARVPYVVPLYGDATSDEVLPAQQQPALAATAS